MATQAHAKAEDVKLDVSQGPQQEPDSPRFGEKEPEVVRVAKEPPQPSAASKLLRSMSIVHQTQNAVSALIEKNQGIPVNHPALNITTLVKMPLAAKASLGAEPEHPLGAETTFKVGDIVQAMVKGHGETIWTGMIMAPLSTVFKEADADGDGKTTFEEWHQRLGHLVEADVLRRLFDECDTDKNGTLDIDEFTVGLQGKYEIKWAQVFTLSCCPVVGGRTVSI